MTNYKVYYFEDGEEEGRVHTMLLTELELANLDDDGIEVFEIEPTIEKRDW